MAKNAEPIGGHGLNIDDILRKCIEEIWSKYDVDKSGFLEKDECKSFILSTLVELNGGGGMGGERTKEEDIELEKQFADNLSNESFDIAFKKIDLDNSGSITQEEMIKFLKLIANI